MRFGVLLFCACCACQLESPHRTPSADPETSAAAAHVDAGRDASVIPPDAAQASDGGSHDGFDAARAPTAIESISPRLLHADVVGDPVGSVELQDGSTKRTVAFSDLATLRLSEGKKTLRFAVRGEALYVPHCGGRGPLRVRGVRTPIAKDGAVVVDLGTTSPTTTSVDVELDVAVSRYERRVACGEAPRSGQRKTSAHGFSEVRFSSPHEGRGGGRAMVFVPRKHDFTKRATLLVGAHPWNGSIHTYANYTSYLAEAERADVVLLHPSALGNSLYVADAETEVHLALRELEKILPVDETKVSIWGASMGGQGATTLAFHKPDKFACVVSFFGDAKFDTTSYVRNILATEAAAHAVNPLDVVDNARHQKVWLIHGEADRTSPIRESELLHSALLRLGYTSEFTRLAGLGHEGRVVESFGAEVVKRAAACTAPQFPTRVTRVSVRTEDDSAYGVRLERERPGDAELDIEARDGSILVHNAHNISQVFLSAGALGLPSGAPLSVTAKKGDVRLPKVRWQ